MALLVALMLDEPLAAKALTSYLGGSNETLAGHVRAVIRRRAEAALDGSASSHRGSMRRRSTDSAVGDWLAAFQTPTGHYQTLNHVAQLIAAYPEGRVTLASWLQPTVRPPLSDIGRRAITRALDKRAGLEEGDDLEALAAAWGPVQAQVVGDTARPVAILFTGLEEHVLVAARAGVPFGVIVQTDAQAEGLRGLLTAMGVPPGRYAIWVGTLERWIESARARFQGYDLRVVAGQSAEAVLNAAGLVWTGLTDQLRRKTRDAFARFV